MPSPFRRRRARRPGPCLLFAALLGCAPPAEEDGPELRFKLHHMLGPVSPAHRTMLVPWAQRLAEQSDGRIVVDIYPAMQLGGQAFALIDQVRDGIVDLCWTLPAYTPGRFPRLEVFELPFFNTDPIAMNLALREFAQHHPEELAEYKVIALFVHAGQILHSKRPLRSVEDLAGLKIRIPSRTSGWMVSAMGSTPIGTSVTKIPEMLSKGIVDAVLIPYEASMALRVHELVDYHVGLDRKASDRFSTQVFVIAMNRDSYDSLPADLQAVIDRNADEETARWLGQLWIDAERPGRERAAQSGELFHLPPDQVEILQAKIRDPTTEHWLEVVARKGIDGRPLIEEASALIAKYSRLLAAEVAVDAGR